MKTKRRPIRSIEDLRAEKAWIRNAISEQEQTLKSHYHDILHKVNPVIYIANLISGNKFFGGIKKEDDNGADRSTIHWVETVLKTFTAAAAGDILYKKSKKNFGKAILAYALEQGEKFITEKDISEHIEKIKEWLKKKEKNTEETDEE